ncbi:hypothetical protein HDU87_007580 [Geranomyces variabilis]|uniref:DUF4709 domain-containing protein n=1 Tax=Geranomyces variabilis TaxID=109894 RepID=A0AAD5TFI3_9FUNG|nr:hypothetical protein HDU87_007580 [Geranomyces variabilis]
MPKRTEKKVLSLFANVFELKPETLAASSAPSQVSISRAFTEDDLLLAAPAADADPTPRIITARRRGRIQAGGRGALVPTTSKGAVVAAASISGSSGALGTMPDAVESCLAAATEYLRLFGVSRAAQTEEKCVVQVKSAENDFADLFKSLQKSRENLDRSYASTTSGANRLLVSHLESRIENLHLMHGRAIDRVRRACRGQYADAVARIMQDAQRFRDTTMAALIEDHQAKQTYMNEHIFAVKREAHRRADLIKKLAGKVARAQVVLKRHGYHTETEMNQCIADERLRGEDTLAHMQSLLYEKEEKVSDLADRVAQMEATIDERLARKQGAPLSTRAVARREKPNSASRRFSRRVSIHKPGIIRGNTPGGGGIDDLGPSISINMLAGGASTTAAGSSVASDPPSDLTSRSTTPEGSSPTENFLETLMQDATALYESRLETMRATHAMRMAALAKDQEQSIRDLETQYSSARQNLSGANAIQDQIRVAMAGEGSVREVVRKLFPRGKKEGFVDSGTNCCLDPFDDQVRIAVT